MYDEAVAIALGFGGRGMRSFGSFQVDMLTDAGMRGCMTWGLH